MFLYTYTTFELTHRQSLIVVVVVYCSIVVVYYR